VEFRLCDLKQVSIECVGIILSGTISARLGMIGVRQTIFAVLIGLSGVLASAQIASESELAAISARGRVLFEYDQAAWHATDAVVASHPPKEIMGRYIARKTEGGWEVAFGHLNQAKDAFVIGVMAMPGASPQEFTVKRIEPPQIETGFFLSAARAIDTVAPGFSGASGRTYNASVIPAAGGQLYVYLEPGQNDADGDYFPLGADVRYLVSADGTTIVETRQMHKSLIPKAQVPAGTKIESGYHTHVLSEIPEDSDVFVVLSRRPPIPEFVGSRTALYSVSTDGSIRFIEKMKKH